MMDEAKNYLQHYKQIGTPNEKSISEMTPEEAYREGFKDGQFWSGFGTNMVRPLIHYHEVQRIIDKLRKITSGNFMHECGELKWKLMGLLDNMRRKNRKLYYDLYHKQVEVTGFKLEEDEAILFGES